MTSCDVSNKIIAWAITSEPILQKIALDITMIDSYDNAIAKAWNNIEEVATLSYAKKWVESKILYQTIGSYVSSVLKQEWISKINKLNELKKTLIELAPNSKLYVEKLDQLPVLKTYVKWTVDESKLASVIAFDIANLHKLQWVVKWWTEMIHYWRMGVWWAYNIYRDVMLDIVDNKVMQGSNELDIIEKIKSYVSKHEWHTKERVLKNPEDIVNIINNASTMKQLEESFILYIHYIDETTLPLFIKKVEDFKYSWDVWTKTFWQSLWESYFNKNKYVSRYRLNEMNDNALAFWQFKWTPFKTNDDYFKFIDNAADLLTGKTTSFTYKWVQFNEKNKDVLIWIVWVNNLEVAYLKRWEVSFQYDYIQQLINADKNIEIIPDVDIWITSVKWFKKQSVDKIVDEAKILESEWKYSEAKKLFDSSIEEWKNILKDSFWTKITKLWNWIWRREWQSEPTIIFWLKSIDENDIDTLVDISQNKFKQKSFFTAENSIDWNYWIIDKKQWLSIEPWVVIYTKNKITLENAKEIDILFEKHWIYAWTILPDGSWIKLYNLSAFNKDYDWFRKSIKWFTKDIANHKLFWVQWATRERPFRIRHLWTSTNQWLWTYRWRKSFRWDKYLSNKSLVYTSTKEYKYTDILTENARKYDSYQDFAKANKKYKKDELTTARKRKDKELEIKELTKDEIELYWPNNKLLKYKDSILRTISRDNNTPPTSQHYFYEPETLYSDSTKELYNDTRALNCFDIWKPKEIIVDIKTLTSRVNAMNEWDTVYIMTRNSTTADELKTLWHKKGVKVVITNPSWASSIRIVNWNAYVWFINESEFSDFVDAFNNTNWKIFASNILLEPIDALKNIKVWDEVITQEVIDMYWLYSPNWNITAIQLNNILRNTSRFNGRYINEVIDYSNAYYSTQAMKISEIIDDVEELSWTKITLKISPDNIQKIKDDYYNYFYAQTTFNKAFAYKRLLENFKIEWWDVLDNYAKKDYIYKQLLLWEWFSINADWFNDFVSLLVRDDVSEAEISSNIFVKNTITKNQRWWNKIVSSDMELYNYAKNTLLKDADNKIYTRNTTTSEFVDVSIAVPREWKWLSIVDNNNTMPPIHSSIWDIIGNSSKYEKWKWFVTTLLKNTNQDVALWQSEELINFINIAWDWVEELFTLYKTKVEDILKKWWNTQRDDLRKLYDNFEYKLMQLEDEMQSTLGWALNKWERLYWFHHQIGRMSQDLNSSSYLKAIDDQKNTIKERLLWVKININNWVANWWILNNGNVLRWSIIEDWANYAYYLSKQSWENTPFDVIKSMDNDTLTSHINLQKSKITTDIQSKWLIYHMYNAISPTLRNYSFLDEYMLVDTPYWYKIPKAFMDINPSLYSNWKALSMDINDEFMKSIYDGIVDMYNDWYKIVWQEPLKITWNIDKNIQQIQTIIEKELNNLSSKYQSELKDVNIKWIRSSYTNVFMPYSSFLIMPQNVIDQVGTLKNVEWWRVWDFIRQYISKEPPESLYVWMKYDDAMIKKITDDVDNLESLAADWIEQTYKDVFSGGISDWMMRQWRSVLEKKWKNERTLLNIQLATKASWKQMANFLYNIVAENMLFSVKLGKWSKKMFRLDIDLLRQSQDTLSSIATKNNTELDVWISKNSKISDLVAYYVARYVNTYKTLLKWTVNDDILTNLHKVFYDIWRDINGKVIDLTDESRNIIADQVHRLATIWDSNSFLWIFNMPTAPKTILSDIKFNLFSDGRVFVDNINEAMEQFDWFNKMFKTTLTKEDYENLFQNMFWWKLVVWKNTAQKFYSWANKYILSIIWPVVRIPTVIWANILSAFSTWFIQGAIRWKTLTKWISKSDSSLLADIMWRYNLLSEFADLSDEWMKQLYKEAERLWWWNVSLWLIRSFQSWWAANTLQLMSTNTNNVMDMTLMWNYKMFALYSAMQTLDGKRFFSVKSFDEYLKTLSDEDLQKLMYIIEWDANRWFYSVVAAADSFMDNRIPSTWLEMFWVKVPTNITRYGSSLIRWLSNSLSFLNGWWDWIVKRFARWVFDNLDIAKYLWKNKFSTEAIDSVVRAIEKRPEYLQWLWTLYADTYLLARWYRYQKSWEDDWQTNLEDFMDALWTITTIWAGYSSSLVWQLFTRWISTIQQVNEQKELTPTDEFKKTKIFAWTIASTVSSRFMSQLKYLKPRKFAIAQAQSDIIKWMDSWDAYSKAIWTMFLTAGSWMLKYMISDNYDPSKLSFSFQDRWDIPAVMWWRISDDQKAAYAQSYISQWDLWNFSNFWSSMWKATLLSSNIAKPLKNLLQWKNISEEEIVQLSYQDKFLVDTLYYWKTPDVSNWDVNSIKSYIFDDSLLDPAYIREYIDSDTWKIKKGLAYIDDAISVVYWTLGKEKMQEVYELIQDTTSKTKWNAKAIAYNILKNAVLSSDLWEVEQLAKSMLFWSSISLKVNWDVPSWKWVTPLDVENYYLKQFKENYQLLKSNNSDMAFNFVVRKDWRLNAEFKNNLYDDKWNIDERYYDYLKQEMNTREAINNWDMDAIEAIYNPITISNRYLWREVRDENWVLNETALTAMNKTMNYIVWTESDRWTWETAAMLVACVSPIQEEVIDAAQKWLLTWWLSEATKWLVDKMFYTEWVLSDYILNLHSGINSVQWWWWGSGSKIKRATAKFEKISDALDKIRWKFKSEITVSKFNIDHQRLWAPAEKVFVAEPSGSYSWPWTNSIFWNDKPETKDISRKIKKSKEFKFK